MMPVAAVAWAGPDTPFARVGERIRSNRRKADTVWTFPDQVVQRRVVRATGEDTRYDAAGQPWVVVAVGPDGPVTVTAQAGGPVAVDVSAWTEVAAWPGARMRAPAGEGPSWTLPEGVLSWRVDPKADPFDDVFGKGLVTGCGCIVADRGTDWLDGRAAARWRLWLPRAEGADQIELWAVPLADGLATLAWVTRIDGDAALAPGRAAAALVRWAAK
jgi:hypothetical protein